jgi:hypothetical protein
LAKPKFILDSAFLLIISKFINFVISKHKTLFFSLTSNKETMMDPATIATMVIAALSPLLLKGTEEVAKTAFKDAYQAIKERFSRKPEKQSALEKFEKNPSTGAPVFQSALAEHLATDTELIRLLATALEESGSVPAGSLVGKIEAEKVVVANKIDTVNM